MNKSLFLFLSFFPGHEALGVGGHMSSVFMKSCTSAFIVAEFKAQRWDGHFSPWWSASVKLSRRRAAPQWFIGASAACLRSIMAPNPSRPRYCHNGNMCVVTVWYWNDQWYYCRGPSPFAYINTHMRVRTLPPYGAHTHALAPSPFNLSRNLLPRRADSISLALIISHRRCVWL